MKMNPTSFPILSQLYLPMIDTSRQKSQIKEIALQRNKSGVITSVQDFVAVEAPLQIEVSGKPVSITMRTPGDDVALALGFLFSEGLINDYNAIADVVQKDENTVNIIPEDGFIIKAESMERNFYSTSSCGVCGKASVDTIRSKSMYIPPIKTITVADKTLFALQERLLTVQSAFELTGGLHACALFTPDGRYLFHSEDVGRHNALDKLIGHTLMAGRLPLDEHILLLSGRASFELVQKASMAGIPIVAAVGAPSSLAIDLAIENHQTLIGFLKKTGFNIYAGIQRIQ
jgi:FdhD protein